MKNKDRYQLSKLKAKFNVTCSGVDLYYKDEFIVYLESYDELFWWLEQDYSPLDEKEKAYLSAVIRPWRDKVECIRKQRFLAKENYEFICIVYRDVIGFNHVDFPNFPKGTMYQGMELSKGYTLEELGL